MTKAAKNPDLYFSGTVSEKLTAAHQLFTPHGSHLLQQQDIRDALAGLREHEAVLDAQMGAMQMGINVTIQHKNDIDCCFLGSHGCILPIKPIFCLNYNCTHIQGAATPEEMRLLENMPERYFHGRQK